MPVLIYMESAYRRADGTGVIRCEAMLPGDGQATISRVCFACRDVLGDWDGAGSEEKIRDEGICNRRGETWEEQAQRMARGADTKSDSIDSALRSLSRAYPKKR